MRYWLLVSFSAISIAFYSQNDSVFIRKIYDEVLTNGKAVEDLRSLCKDVGHRLSGSASAEMAVKWGEQRLKQYGFDTVYLQEIRVPHWERGTKEGAWVQLQSGAVHQLRILALGGSIGTDGVLKGEVVVFNSLEEVKMARIDELKDKIVFINQKMDQKHIQTFKAYGACHAIRSHGAVEASLKGAKAVLIRSLAIPTDPHPHTGSMHYNDSVTKIPAAALSTADADRLATLVYNNQCKQLYLEMNCQQFPDQPSYNVIAEMWGKRKNEIISFGGHLDSWDTGEGAHDDGAGIVHCMEALRTLQVLNYRPNHTLRCVFFMNEENGNKGGEGYAEWSKKKGEKQVAAVETDRGGFSPRGFDVDGSAADLQWLRKFSATLKPYDLLHLEAGFGGVDISPLKKSFPGIALFGLATDSQRYFDFHHAETDVFENVNHRELLLGAAAIASLIYLIDQHK